VREQVDGVPEDCTCQVDLNVPARPERTEVVDRLSDLAAEVIWRDVQGRSP
jgi:hypothetical protein